MSFDPRLDLVLERFVDVPPDLVWLAWTDPRHLVHWFTPAPWRTVECQIELVPGGLFRTVMSSPEGELHPNVGCYLEIVPGRRLVWTDALEAGFRPTRAPAHLGFRFTASVDITPHGGGTRYVATVKHADESSREAHAAMGFADGWGATLDQLVRHVRGLGPSGE